MYENRLDLFDLVQESIIIRDLDGRITRWNEAATTIYGWAFQQAIGRSVHELLRTSGIDLKAAEASVYENGNWSGDIERRTAGGRKIIVEASWSAQLNADGLPAGIVETGIDVTLSTRRRLAGKLAHRGVPRAALCCRYTMAGGGHAGS